MRGIADFKNICLLICILFIFTPVKLKIHSGKFPIGVTKYLTWKQTLWMDRFTSTHHLWTIPLFIFGANEFDGKSYALSIFIVVEHVLLSRWLTPHFIEMGDVGTRHIGRREGKDDVVGGAVVATKKKSDEEGRDESDPRRYRYLNVNLSHELWKDLSFSFFANFKRQAIVLGLFVLVAVEMAVIELFVFSCYFIPS